MSVWPLRIDGLAQLLRVLALPIVGGAVFAMTVVSLLAQPVWGDQSWLLYAAIQALDGARIGTDIVETNPPTIIWLSEIPAALSRLIDVSPQTAMKICIALLILLSLTWCASLLHRSARSASGTMALCLAIAIPYATTVYPWADIGQREHIMVLLLLPYLVTSAIRLDGVSPAAWQGFAAGAAALIGLSMKPQHLLIVVGVEALLAYRNGPLRSLTRAEAAGVTLAGLVYGAALAIFAPEYVLKVVPLVYEAYSEYSVVPLGALIEPRRTAKVVALIVLWAAMRRRLRYRALSDVFAIAAVGATLGYLVQGKGWQYQFVPAGAFFILLLGMMIADALTQWNARLKPPPSQTPLAVATGTASFLLLGALYYPIQSAKAAAHSDEIRVAPQQAVTAALPAGVTIVVLGPNYGTIFDFVLERRQKWGSRLMGYWTLEAIFDAETMPDGKPKAQRLARLAEVVRWTRATMVDDLQRWKPSVVLVERCAEPTISCGTSEAMRQIDVLQWLEKDPAFRVSWANYTWCRQVGYYDVWHAKNDQAACHDLAAIPAFQTSQRP